MGKRYDLTSVKLSESRSVARRSADIIRSGVIYYSPIDISGVAARKNYAANVAVITEAMIA